jgi:hypothetical protein
MPDVQQNGLTFKTKSPMQEERLGDPETVGITIH